LKQKVSTVHRYLSITEINENGGLEKNSVNENIDMCFFLQTHKFPALFFIPKYHWYRIYHQDGKEVELILQLEMEYFGIMETHKLLLQWKEQGSVKGLESVTCFM